jgi:hypothetical protein
MCRIFASWLLLLAALYVAWLIMPARAQDLGFGVWKTPRVACVAPTLDPNANAVKFADWSTGMTFALPAISSTSSNVVVVLFVETNSLTGGGTITPTDSAALMSFGVSFSTSGVWSGTNRSGVGAGSGFVEFVGKSSAALSADIITITYNQTPSFATAHVFIVDGTNFSAPFDPNGSLPNASGTANVNATVATTNPCTMIINGVAENSTATPTAPWTQVLQRNFMFTQYARFTSAQASFTISQFGGTSSEAIGDALTSP